MKDCPEVVKDLARAVSDCGNGVHDGDKCKVSCKPGYTGDTSDYVCSDGNW